METGFQQYVQNGALVLRNSYDKEGKPVLAKEKLQEELGIGVGETTEDGLFSIECCRCVGACGLAPVLTINDKVHGHLVPEDIPSLIAEIKAAEEQN